MPTRSRALKDSLTAARDLPTREVEIPGIGSVLVRGLSRAEAFTLQGLKTVADVERAMLVLGMVDPPMTAADIDAWMAASPAKEIDPVSNAITELSGLSKGADRAAAMQFRE